MDLRVWRENQEGQTLAKGPVLVPLIQYESPDFQLLNLGCSKLTIQAYQPDRVLVFSNS